jgi:hypothetical protein
MANPSFLDSLTSYAHKLGKLTRQTVTAAGQVYEDLQPTIEAALKAAATLTDAEKRAEALKQFDAFKNRVLADGTSVLRQQLTTLSEAFAGAPASVAPRLSAYTLLLETADAKGARELREVQDCSQQVTVIRDAIAAKQDASEVEKHGERLGELLQAATTAVDSFDASEDNVRRLVIESKSTLTDIAVATTERDAALTSLNETVKDAVVPASSATVDAGALQARVNEAEAALNTQCFSAAALKLHNWTADAAGLLASLRVDAETISGLANRPAQLKRQLDLTLNRAKVKGLQIAAGELQTLYLAANKAVKEQRPCDVDAAKLACDRYHDKVSELIAALPPQA